jgi:hypothetical protein
MVDALVVGAAYGEGDGAASSLACLVDGEAGPAWCELVTARVSLALVEHVTLVLEQGWEPLDISAVLRRRAGVAAAGLAEEALPEACARADACGPRSERWESQLADLVLGARPLSASAPDRARDVGAAVAAIGVMARLGPLPDLATAGASQVRLPGLDQAVLEKVRALLAKAEATTFDEEADAFFVKAQELMARHNLDRAVVDGAGEPGAVTVEARRCWLDDPYLKQKAYLLAVVARANRCRSVSVYEYGFVTLFGHPDDLSVTEMLFTALLVHATKHMTLPLRSQGGQRTLLDGLPSDQVPEAPGRPRASCPSYRRSFLLSYAERIGHRFAEAASAATQAAVRSSGEALLPVLASRERHVEEALQEMFPETKSTEYAVTDYEGWAAGRAAADLADLTLRSELADTAV